MELPADLLPLPPAPEGYQWEYGGIGEHVARYGTFCVMHILPKYRKDFWWMCGAGEDQFSRDAQGCHVSDRYHWAELHPIGQPEPKHQLQDRKSFIYRGRWEKPTQWIGTIIGRNWSQDERKWFYVFDIGPHSHKMRAVEADIL